MVSPAHDLRPADGLHLVIRSGAARGTSYFARSGARIGRHPLNEVCVREPGVESHHAVLERVGRTWQVRDISGKGIHQSGRLVPVAVVQSGDRILLGGVELELLDHPPDQEPTRHTETITAPLPLQRGTAFPLGTSLSADALEALLALQARMAEESQADAMVTALADWLREAIPAHHHAVLLTNEAGQLVVAATRCDDPRGAPRPSNTILNQALQQRVGVLVIDAADDQRIRVGHSISTQNIRSAVAVPMVSHGKLVGALYAATQGVTAAFERRHLDMLTLVAGPAAGNLESARLVEALGQTNRDLLRRLAMCARFNDDDTGYHIQRVGDYSAALARAVGKTGTYPQLLRVAAPMHDIGKIGIPQSILQKPGKLTPEEFEVMKRHAIIGEEILGGSPAPLIQLAAEVAGSHHEKWNGSGYPRGLAGEAIPLSGRIVAVADVFDALTSERVYKPAFPLEKALQLLRDGAGAHFDPQIVAAFFDILQEILQIRDHYAQIEALPSHLTAKPSR